MSNAEQCPFCRQWFHYEKDKPVCRACWRAYKEWEYNQPMKVYDDEES